jgi:hypothetical protein
VAVTLSGLQEPARVHYYFYTFQALQGYLHFQRDYKGRVEFSQSYFRIHSPPPQAEIDTMYPVMRQIEANLQRDCALPALKVQEYCRGVKCGN